MITIQHIQMISEGLCDTEDWSYDCWKFSFATHTHTRKCFHLHGL